MRNETSALDHALREMAEGAYVFPLLPRSKKPFGSDHVCPSGHQHDHGFHSATNDPEVVTAWFAAHPHANIGVDLERSRQVVLDYDRRNDTDGTAQQQLAGLMGPLPETRIVLTRQDGSWHRLFRANGVLYKSAPTRVRGIDIKHHGGYRVAAGSIHPDTGEPYEYQEMTKALPLAECPDLSPLTDTADRKEERLDDPAGSLPVREGERHNTIVSLAGRMRHAGMSKDAALAAALAENRTFDPPLADEEVEGVVDSVYRLYPSGTIGAVPRALTDLGNAERLVDRHGQDLLYSDAVGRRGTFLVWDGSRWREDDTQESVRFATATVRGIYAEAEAAPDPDVRKRIAKHAVESEAAGSIKAMLELAQAQVPVRMDALDADPWLFNVTNGTIDLRTSELRPHSRDDRITRIAPVTYDADAACPLWDAFLERVLPDPAVRAFVHRACGYALTGETREQKLILMVGPGANGKSTFQETVRAVFGDYALHADFNTFLTQRGDKVRDDIARLRPARLVTSTEVEEGRALAEVVVKQLTGGDTIAARHLFAKYFEYRPQFKLFLAANHKPIIKGTDYAIWRRICLVPFEVTIPEEERDPQLVAKLRAEAPGIFAWMVRGCAEWQKQGLRPPEAVLDATKDYRTEMDTFADFLARATIVDPGSTSTSKELYKAYSVWASANGEKPMAQNMFGLHLAERGFQKTSTGTERGWRGLRPAGGLL